MLFALLACSDPEPPAPSPTWTAETRTQAIAAGREVLGRHECRRCHVIDELPDPPREDHCTSCHVWLDGLEPGSEHYTSISEKYGEDVLIRYQTNIEHLKVTPDLSGLGLRVRPDWITAFVQDPEDLRPHLEESMIRTNLSEAEALAVGRYFAAVAEVEYAPDFKTPPRPDMDRGAALFEAKGCGTCHWVGNLGNPPENPVSALAPNLRYVRERMTPTDAANFIRDPQSMKPGTLMPSLGLSPSEALLIRDWLWHVDPALGPVPEFISPSPPPASPVAWEEVNERVFGRICVHCHMNDHEKDPGPGNEGGLGYEGVDLSMRTYAEFRRGWVRDGERVPLSQGLIDAMLRRHHEAARDQVPAGQDHAREAYAGLPGMPLGLPAIPLEDIQLVRDWIAGGCPGPTEQTGVEGVTDGYLVPDGPTDLPLGCGLIE